MSFNDAHAFAFSLATTLMAAIVIFRAGDGTLSVTPAAEYDGDDAAIVRELAPFAPGRGENRRGRGGNLNGFRSHRRSSFAIFRIAPWWW